MARAEPKRTCVGCRAVRPKQEMLRIARTPDGIVSVDAAGRSEGRGVYVCRNAHCLDEAVRRKALERGLKGPVPPDVVVAARAAVDAG